MAYLPLSSSRCCWRAHRGVPCSEDNCRDRAIDSGYERTWLASPFWIIAFTSLVFLPNSTTFLLAASTAALAVVLLFYNIDDRAQAFTLLLGAIAFGLVAVCEIFFLKDVFAGNFPRMNTVFKFYFQAWALLSIASGAGLFFILESFR